VAALGRLGVRARVQASFALGGLLVSVFLSAVAWELTTTYLYNQRELSTLRTALVSADLLQRRLEDGTEPTVEALQQSVASGSDAVYLPPGGQVGTAATPQVRAVDLPDALVEQALQGQVVQQRVTIDGRPLQAVGLPLRDGAALVELFPLTELDRSMRALSTVLAVTTVLTALLAAAVGRWAAWRTLRPLQAVAAAADEVARGHLDARVEAAGDPDLQPLADAFNTTTAQLRTRVERDARFASDVSHELRSPVTTLVNVAEVLANRRSELSPGGQEALDLLRSELDRFQHLVTDLLEISSGDQRRALSASPLRLDELVVRAADREAGRPVTRVAPDAVGAVVAGEARRLEQVVGNLVANAQAHGGGVREVAVTRSSEAVQVRVTDDGPGVVPAERERVFERFYRGPSSRARLDGSGLGLAIVAEHVRAHGGRTWVEDGQPAGACFVVELPALDEL
jgi:two-component system sensor histidine kinase MtrB